MTKQESGYFLNEMTTLYPNMIRQNGSINLMASLWAEALKDQDYFKMHEALLSYFRDDKRGYAPTAGQLIDLIDEKADNLMPDDHVYLGW